jgi:hypothetical protein
MQALHRTAADSMLRPTQPRALFLSVSNAAAPRHSVHSSRGSKACRATPPEQQQQGSAGTSQPGNVQLNEGRCDRQVYAALYSHNQTVHFQQVEQLKHTVWCSTSIMAVLETLCTHRPQLVTQL